MKSIFTKKGIIKFLLLIFYALPVFLSAQTQILSGIVLDGSTNEPMPFTNILINGANLGATAGSDGKFKFTLPPQKYALIFSFVGYRTLELPVTLLKKDTVIIVRLFPTDNLLQTVTVYSGFDKNQSEEISSITLKNERVETVSTVLRDVFRAVTTLPGISSNNELSAKYNVRGGNYDENLVLVNGTQVYEPFHIKEASEVSVGIFNVDLMRKVDLMTGGFSAQFGDKMSSVLNIDYREGSKEKFSSNLSLSSLNLDALFEGPLNDKGSFIVAIRKSYFEYILSYLGFGKEIKPSYYDIQGSLGYNLSPKNKLLFQFIHAGDDFKLEPYTETSTIKGTGYYRQEAVTYQNRSVEFENVKSNYYSNLFDLQSVNILNNDAILKSEISLYNQIDDEYSIDTFYFRQDINSSKSYFYEYKSEHLYKNYLKINTIEGKVSFNFKPSLFHDIKTGINYQRILYDQNLSDLFYYNISNTTDKYPDTVRSYSDSNPTDNADNRINPRSYKISGFIEDTWQINDRFFANLGARADYFDINKELTISPRFSISYATTFGTTIRAAWGYFYQSPTYSQLAYSFSSDTNTKSQKSTHYILGLEHKFQFNGNSNLTLKLESYYKDYYSLIASDRSTYWRLQYSKKNDSKGYAKGIDLYADYMTPGFSFWISYGLLEAKEQKDNSSDEYFRFTNQTHTLSIVSDIDLGKDWSLNLRLAYGSGYPYTPYSAAYNNSLKKWEWKQGEKNSETLPFYKRVDTRLSKSFTIWNLPVSAYLDVINLFNFKNLLSYRYKIDDNGNPVKKEVLLFPVLPALGITIKY